MNEVVDKELLIQRRDEGSDLLNLCVISSMDSLYSSKNL